MDFHKDDSGVSGEALKLAAAIIIAVAVFSILASFALGPKNVENVVSNMGKTLLDTTQNASYEILNETPGG